MNSLDKLISTANVRGSLDLRCQFQGDWARDHQQEALGKAPYHIVLKGECRVELASGQRPRCAPATFFCCHGARRMCCTAAVKM